jgi:hypothetical protein
MDGSRFQHAVSTATAPPLSAGEGVAYPHDAVIAVITSFANTISQNICFVTSF